jgi:hypothetical protein
MSEQHPHGRRTPCCSDEARRYLDRHDPEHRRGRRELTAPDNYRSAAEHLRIVWSLLELMPKPESVAQDVYAASGLLARAALILDSVELRLKDRGA